MTTSWIAAALWVAMGAAGDETSGKDGGPAKSAALADKALAPYQEKLLDLAFKAASSLPTNPHQKNRARMQGDVVAACFELDQPRRALRCIEKIDNWRRGLGLADYAFYCAKHGGTSPDVSEIEHYLSQAQEIADTHRGDDAQDWEKERILGSIAATRLVLGQKEQAGAIAKKLESAEAARIEPVKAGLADAAACDRQLDAMDHLVVAGTFDQIQFGLRACAQLYDLHFGDAERRAKIEAKIESSWAKLPLQIQIELLEELAGYALAHNEPAVALQQVHLARTMVDGANWAADDRIPLVARLAGLRFRCGERDPAKADADAALALFDAQRTKIVDIYRAKVLRSLAESYQTMGDTGDALRCYIRAVDAGVENPNSRPRADDLAATCVSMAIHGVPPDGELSDRLVAIGDKLGPPW
jgi:hypothetical protein